jgi:hypothetical protein
VAVVLQPPMEGSLYGSRRPGRRISSSRRNSRIVLKHGILQRYVVFASKTASMSGGEVISPRICRAGTRDRRPGRSRTPAGSGSSWVCRSPATTSRRPVFRGRLQRRRTYGSVSVVAVLLGGGPAGSVAVTRCDSLRIRPLRRALHLTCPSWLPTPAWPTSWPDQKPVRSRA